MRKSTLFSLFFLAPVFLFSQGTNTLMPAETYVLELLMGDTVSSTVSYLQRGYGFGIGDRGDRNLILVKEGKFNYFLMDGTNRVYLARRTPAGIRLERQDRTTHEGDNYIMMAFSRKDTLFQYGGYGFWKARDFFTYFIPGLGEWEFLEGGEGLENMYTWNFYDPDADKFYTMGRVTSDPHRSVQKIIEDSVFEYDFSTKQFHTLGKITAFDWKNEHIAPLGASWTSPFGMGFNWRKELRLADFGRNMLYTSSARIADSVNLSIQRMHSFDSRSHCMLYLRDTLYFIGGNERQVNVSKLRLTKSDFDTLHGKKIYEPVTVSGRDESPFSMPASRMLIISGGLIAAASALAYRAGRKNSIQTAEYTSQENPDPKGMESKRENLSPNKNPVSSSPESDLLFFLKQLSPVERDLLKEMVLYSLQDRKMDADVMNKILGVSSKDPEIQKARRSNAITHINNTFTQTTKISGLLIRRERDSFDKRAYVYFVPDDMTKVLSRAFSQ